jgi:hypothetical protein
MNHAPTLRFFRLGVVFVTILVSPAVSGSDCSAAAFAFILRGFCDVLTGLGVRGTGGPRLRLRDRVPLATGSSLALKLPIGKPESLLFLVLPRGVPRAAAFVVLLVLLPPSVSLASSSPLASASSVSCRIRVDRVRLRETLGPSVVSVVPGVLMKRLGMLWQFLCRHETSLSS